MFTWRFFAVWTARQPARPATLVARETRHRRRSISCDCSAKWRPSTSDDRAPFARRRNLAWPWFRPIRHRSAPPNPSAVNQRQEPLRVRTKVRFVFVTLKQGVQHYAPAQPRAIKSRKQQQALTFCICFSLSSRRRRYSSGSVWSSQKSSRWVKTKSKHFLTMHRTINYNIIKIVPCIDHMQTASKMFNLAYIFDKHVHVHTCTCTTCMCTSTCMAEKAWLPWAGIGWRLTWRSSLSTWLPCRRSEPPWTCEHVTSQRDAGRYDQAGTWLKEVMTSWNCVFTHVIKSQSMIQCTLAE